MKENKIKVVTYLRVGSYNSNDISRNENEMYRLIDSHKDDWDVIAQFEDLGCSGTPNCCRYNFSSCWNGFYLFCK